MHLIVTDFPRFHARLPRDEQQQLTSTSINQLRANSFLALFPGQKRCVQSHFGSGGCPQLIAHRFKMQGAVTSARHAPRNTAGNGRPLPGEPHASVFTACCLSISPWLTTNQLTDQFSPFVFFLLPPIVSLPIYSHMARTPFAGLHRAPMLEKGRPRHEAVPGVS